MKISKIYTFISDTYRQNRGGWSRILTISCKVCETFLFHYQKDGSGPLKRCYFDRILDIQPKFNDQRFVFCPHCKACLGFNEPYAKEHNRPALRWAVEAINYKVISASEITT